jgi:hypothetical protein
MTEAEFKARYPQFNTNTGIATYLTESLFFIGEGFEEYADMAQGLYVAHYCQLEQEERARALAVPNATYARDVVSKSGGKASLSRSGEMLRKASEDPMMVTTYGQRFCFLRKFAGMGMVAAGAKRLNDDGTGLTSPDFLTNPDVL